MPYIRSRGRQLVLVHGQRSPSTGQVDQRVLFIFFSQAEAKEALGDSDDGMDDRFRSILEDQYPEIRFNWKRIRRQVVRTLSALPPVYGNHEADRKGEFRKDLGAFVRRLVLTHPGESPAARDILRKHKIELEYLADQIQESLKLALDSRLVPLRDDDRVSYWRFMELGNEVPLETEEFAAGLFERRELDRAEAVFSLLVESFDRFAEGYNFLGLIALERGRLEEAVSWFERTVQVGRNLFPKRLGRSHYWTKLETRPYMRGLSNLAYSLNAVGRHEEALAICDRLERECGDPVRASSHRSSILLSTGKWVKAREAARCTLGLDPSQGLLIAFAASELVEWEEALAHFLHAALNNPQSIRILLGGAPRRPRDHDDQESQDLARSLRTRLRAFFSRQSPDSRKFFEDVAGHPRFQLLIDKVRAVKERWKKNRDNQDRTDHKLLLEMQGLPYARKNAKELLPLFRGAPH